MRRSVKGLAAIGALALLLTACGDSDDSADEGGGDPGSISGTVTWWDTSDAENEAPAFQALVDQFEEEYPDVTVEVVNVPFSEAQNKFKTAAQSGAGAPDVIRSEVAWSPEFASLGYLQDLTDTAAADGLDDYLAGPLGSNEYDGKLYGVPQVTDAPALLYNKALLEQAGVEVPTTWAELQAAAPKFEAIGVDTLYMSAGGYFLMPFIYSEGGDLVNADDETIDVNDAESVAGLDVRLGLQNDGVTPKDTSPDSYNNMQAAFKDGKVAMVINGPWSIADSTSGTAFADPNNLGVAPTPAGSVKSGSPVGGHNYAIYAGSENLDASYEFVKFMNSAESQAVLAGELGLLPTRQSAYELPETQSNQFVVAFQPVMELAVARPPIPEGGQFFAPLDEQYVSALNGEVDAQTALDNVASAYEELLPGFSDS